MRKKTIHEDRVGCTGCPLCVCSKKEKTGNNAIKIVCLGLVKGPSLYKTDSSSEIMDELLTRVRSSSAVRTPMALDRVCLAGDDACKHPWHMCATYRKKGQHIEKAWGKGLPRLTEFLALAVCQ